MNTTTEEFKDLLNALAEACPQLEMMINNGQIKGLLPVKKISQLIVAYEKYIEDVS